MIKKLKKKENCEMLNTLKDRNGEKENGKNRKKRRKKN